MVTPSARHHSLLIAIAVAGLLSAPTAHGRAFVAEAYEELDFSAHEVLVFPLLEGCVEVTDSFTLKGCFGAEKLSSFDVARGLWTNCERPAASARLFDGGARLMELRGDSLRPEDTTLVTQQLREQEPCYHVFVPTAAFARELRPEARFVLVITHMDIRGTLAGEPGGSGMSIPILLPIPFVTVIATIPASGSGARAVHKSVVRQYAGVEYVVWDMAKDRLVAFGEQRERTRRTRTVTPEMFVKLLCELHEEMWESLPFGER